MRLHRWLTTTETVSQTNVHKHSVSLISVINKQRTNSVECDNCYEIATAMMLHA
jgi:hypothetical protein